MRFELYIILITAFVIYNAYHDWKYIKMLTKYKKYIQIAGFAFLGFIFYLMVKRDPKQFKNVLLHANNVVKYMPIDKSAMDLFNPILDFTPTQFLEENENDDNININGLSNSSEQRILRSGSKGTKRSVSETKKKYVASMQDWKCKHCKKTLTAWFEVDHVKRLEHGGNNDVTNLVALCRECHGEKTAFENM
uniref:HNH nuclease domain-containing protein n=1 Tax=viral metagenome TaxID=1070528 RepID=A0A6C0LGR2_9ZZZZ